MGMLQARRHEKDFQLRRKQEFLDQHAAIMRTIAGKLTELAAMQQDAGNAELIKKVQTGVQSYAAAFGEMGRSTKAAGLDETQGYLGELRNAVHAVEQSLKQVNRPDVIVPMLMMRRHEKDFLARLDPAYAAEVKQRLPEFQAALDTAGLAPALRTDLTEKMATYQWSFAEMVKAKLEEGAAAKKLSAAYGELDPTLTALGKTFDDSLRAARAASDVANQQANRTILGGIGFRDHGRRRDGVADRTRHLAADRPHGRVDAPARRRRSRGRRCRHRAPGRSRDARPGAPGLQGQCRGRPHPGGGARSPAGPCSNGSPSA
ncbi:MAG: hypothetical protein WDO24_18030 [Pseudomonadota bacterium]